MESHLWDQVIARMKTPFTSVVNSSVPYIYIIRISVRVRVHVHKDKGALFFVHLQARHKQMGNISTKFISHHYRHDLTLSLSSGR